MRIRVDRVGEEEACVVEVDPSPKPVFAKVSKRERAFYVRINNSTRPLDGPDLASYLGQRWR